jgi:hypothetical protein
MKLHLKKPNNQKASGEERRPQITKPTTSHAKTRGRSMGLNEEEKIQNYPTFDNHSINNSYILNSSYQHNPNNYSFDYYQGRNSVNNNPNLTIYKAESKSRKTRQENSPMNFYTTGTHGFHKRGNTKA